MHNVKIYVKQNRKQLQDIFNSMGTDETIQATKVYQFLQSAFDTKQFKFLQDGKSFFGNEQNGDKIQNLMEEYYLKNNEGETKFYMYRVQFQFEEVIDIIRFWLGKDKSISVYYKEGDENKKVKEKEKEKQKQKQKEKQQKVNQSSETKNQNKVQKNINQNTNKQEKTHEQKDQSSNEFMPQIKNIPQIIKKYKQQINKCQQKIKTEQLNEEEIQIINEKIKQLETKIIFLEDRLRENPIKISNDIKNNKNKHKTQNQRDKSQHSQNSQSISPSPSKRIQKQISPAKIQSTLKSIYQFYAKQLHVTGVKASFQRIEHQSNRINYQKLVHFLKQYKIFPEQTKDQKKLHQFYVKSSTKTRDLTYQGFISILEKLADIIIPAQTQKNIASQNVSRLQLLKYRIIEQRKKNKTLNNPFHSLQKQDFRIDKASLKYEFKLMPLNGKDPQQITSQLQNRKLIKQQKKNERDNVEMKKKIRYIRKLQSIDPFHPMVQKNKHLIKQKSFLESQPVVSMDNMEMFRDKSFGLRMLGIGQEDEVENTGGSSILGRSIASNNSYLVRNRVQQVQKIEVQKMKSLMSGIIERSNAKLQKLGLSPSKRMTNIY